MNDYTLKDLAEDVRMMIAYLRENGVIGLHEGIDFHAATVLTEDGEIDVDVLLGQFDVAVQVPESIIRKVRWYTSRNEITSWQEPTD